MLRIFTITSLILFYLFNFQRLKKLENTKFNKIGSLIFPNIFLNYEQLKLG